MNRITEQRDNINFDRTDLAYTTINVACASLKLAYVKSMFVYSLEQDQ